MLIGYARISKADGSQSLDLQRDALREAGVSDDAIYEDQASGQREDRPGLAAFLKAARQGDVIVVWRLDRLGRIPPKPRRARRPTFRWRLNLVTNAIVTWNTVYMNAAIERLRAEGRIGRDIDLGHLSPALYGHVNPYGKYRFEIEGRAPSLRPLRSPGNDA